MIYAAADLHLSPLIWQDMPSLYGDSYAALSQIVEICAASGKGTTLLLCGDVFDKSKPDSDSIAKFVNAMARLRGIGINVYAIQGQHEKASPPWADAVDSASYVGDGVPFVIYDGKAKVSVIGFDCTSTTDLQAKLNTVEKVDILLLHQMAKQAIDIEGEWEFDIDQIHKNIKLVIAGDYHEQMNVGRLWYPGATHLRKINESGPKYILKIDPKDLSVTPVALKTRQLVEINIVTEAQLDDAVKTIMDCTQESDRPTEISIPLVIARYSSGVKDVIPRIEDACHKRGFMLRTKSVVADDDEYVEMTMPQASTTLLSCLDSVIDREQDADLHSFALSLLQSNEPRRVLQETKEQLGIGG